MYGMFSMKWRQNSKKIHTVINHRCVINQHLFGDSTVTQRSTVQSHTSAQYSHTQLTVESHTAAQYIHTQQHSTVTHSSTVQSHTAAQYSHTHQHSTVTLNGTVQSHTAYSTVTHSSQYSHTQQQSTVTHSSTVQSHTVAQYSHTQ
jgi:hypothetical protein